MKPFEARIAGKLDAAGAPLAKFGQNVFGDERDMGVAADELVFRGVASGRGKGEIRVAVGRRDDDPGTAGAGARVEDKLKAEGFDVEADAAIEVADEDGDGLQAQEGFVARCERSRGVAGKIGGTRHGRYYKPYGPARLSLGFIIGFGEAM